MGLRLPPNTSFAVDKTNRIRCLLFPSGNDVASDVTNDPGARCPAAPVLTPESGSLGERVVANVSMFVIDVPLRATGPVAGGLLVGEVESDQLVEPQGPAYPAVTLTEPPLPPGGLKAVLVCVWDNPYNPGPC